MELSYKQILAEKLALQALQSNMLITGNAKNNIERGEEIAKLYNSILKNLETE